MKQSTKRIGEMFTYILFVLLMGCSPHQLDKDSALHIVGQEEKYPRVIDYDIYCSDPVHARKVIDAGLERQGMVIVQKTQKLKDVGNPLISFTDLAQPYLLPTPEEDKKYHVQKVRLAEEILNAITSIQYNDDHSHATVEYQVSYKNITPFSLLMKRDFSKPYRKTVMFIYSDKGWKVANDHYPH